MAALTIVVTTAVLHTLRQYLTTPTVALLYLLPVVLSTTLWGLGPGIVASLGAFLAVNYYFIPPLYTLLVHQTQDLLALVALLAVAALVSQLVGRTRSSLAQAQAREREAAQLYELSLALVGLRDAGDIARELAERIREAVQAAAVEVALPGELFRVPSLAQKPDAPPLHTLPLVTARGPLGEIRLWREAAALGDTDLRLLNTFAGQGALALERARLAQSETRTRVLEESDRLKSALLSSVSHELRTPLATIKASVSGLRSGEVEWQAPARDDLLAVVEEEVDHLNRLVGNLLDMSRIEAGALEPQRRWYEVADIVDDTLARLRRATERHRLAIDLPDDLPLAPVDHALMERVFANLISNSVKYAPPDSVIGVRARPQGDRTLLVQITNQGPPVAEGDLEHIFDKFHRVTPASAAPATGTGLGLSICKGIVEAHGGRIWAENLPAGFAFNFTLPLAWDGMEPPRLAPEAEPQ